MNKMPFILTKEDKDSKLWHKLMAHWEEKLSALRAQNDGDKAENITANLRGRIAEVKANLSLNNELPNID